MTNYSFESDNCAPACEQVVRALLECNQGAASAYGDDALTGRLNAVYSEFFGHDAFVFPVATGTAGNGLALGAITPPYGTIFSHAEAHIVTTECGAPEFYSGGGRLSLLDGEHAKIAPQTLQDALERHGAGNVHHMAASALSLTQATEAGAAYSLDELRELCAVAHNAGLKVHLDGARFANALVHLGASPAEMSWQAGVDVLTFGTTKNGTFNAEAVVAFDAETAAALRFLHKRGGHLFSKMRYMSAQLLSYLDNGLWRDNAAAANAKAGRLRAALEACPGVEIVHPADINELFVLLPPALEEALARDGWRFLPWRKRADGQVCRLVASWCEPEEQIEALAALCRRLAAAATA